MTLHQKQMLAFLRQVLERSQVKAICDLCGETLTGWEAEHREVNGEMIPNHHCSIDERTQAAVRRTWVTLTGDPARSRAKGYAVR